MELIIADGKWQQYRLTWEFPNGQTLTRLVHFNSECAAIRAARSEEFYRPVFRRANLHSRTASAFEYLDRFPVPSAVLVRDEHGLLLSYV